VKEREEKIEEIYRVMAESAEKQKNKISFDVSGKKFTVKKETLLQHKNTYFTAMLGSGHWQPDNKGRYFLDRDPKMFDIVMSYLRTGQLVYKEGQREQVYAELDYFQLPLPEDDATVPTDSVQTPKSRGTLLSNTHREQIERWLDGKKLGEMLYKSTEDGATPKDFHRQCDNKEATLTVIQSSDGYLFGGYTTKSWSSTIRGYVEDREAFVYTLINPHNTQPTKLGIKRPQRAINNDLERGPIFGYSFVSRELLLFNGNTSYSYLYYDGAYDKSGYNYDHFTPAHEFTPREVEVYKVI